MQCKHLKTLHHHLFSIGKQTLAASKAGSKRILHVFSASTLCIALLSCGGCGHTGALYLPNTTATNHASSVEAALIPKEPHT